MPKKKHKQTDASIMKSNNKLFPAADGLLFDANPDLRQGTPQLSRKGDKKKSANVTQDSSRNNESSVDTLN